MYGGIIQTYSTYLVLKSLDEHVAGLALEVVVGHIQAAQVGQCGDGLESEKSAISQDKKRSNNK